MIDRSRAAGEWQEEPGPDREPGGSAGGPGAGMPGGGEPDPVADRAALDAFMLALRVMLHTYAIEGPGTEYEKPWALLRQIADGELTLMSPAELGARHPGLRDFVYDYANELVKHDREVAVRVLRGLGSAM